MPARAKSPSYKSPSPAGLGVPLQAPGGSPPAGLRWLKLGAGGICHPVLPQHPAPL